MKGEKRNRKQHCSLSVSVFYQQTDLGSFLLARNYDGSTEALRPLHQFHRVVDEKIGPKKRSRLAMCVCRLAFASWLDKKRYRRELYTDMRQSRQGPSSQWMTASRAVDQLDGQLETHRECFSGMMYICQDHHLRND